MRFLSRHEEDMSFSDMSIAEMLLSRTSVIETKFCHMARYNCYVFCETAV